MAPDVPIPGPPELSNRGFPREFEECREVGTEAERRRQELKEIRREGAWQETLDEGKTDLSESERGRHSSGRYARRSITNRFEPSVSLIIWTPESSTVSALVRLLRKLRRLNENAKLDREEIVSLREREFRTLLRHVWESTEFYPEYYADYDIDRQDLDTLPIEDLPSIDTETYVENFDAITTDDALTREAIDRFVESHDRDARFRDEYTVVHTSGTTGEPTYFVYDRDAWDTILAGAVRAVQGEFGVSKLLADFVTGYRVAYVAATEGRFGGVMAVDRATSGLGFDSLHLDVNRPLAEWESELADFDPDVVVGYPSVVKLVCDFVAEDELELDVFRVITGGEPLFDELRRYIETTLGTEVFDVYGASESIVLGIERGDFDGMFLFDDLNYVEPAQRVTYITPLYNYTQPLIRFELDDKLAPTERTSSEPLPFTKVESVVGRSEEIMWFERPDGTDEFLHPAVLETIEAEGLVRYQFVQRSDTTLDIRLEHQETVDQDRVEHAVRTQLERILEEKGLQDLEYSIVHVDEMPIDPDTGKRPLVVGAR